MVRLGGFRRAGRRSSRSFGQQCARELEIRDLVSQTVECSSVVVVAWHPAFFAHILLAIHYPLPAAYCLLTCHAPFRHSSSRQPTGAALGPAVGDGRDAQDMGLAASARGECGNPLRGPAGSSSGVPRLRGPCSRRAWRGRPLGPGNVPDRAAGRLRVERRIGR